mmetsp:Transcript_33138/g.82460  ORF Transcript_33138/g.82460 Transcript_33138/m.82460 type:complete len:307 (-) Transcript_33138:40-960(-)
MRARNTVRWSHPSTPKPTSPPPLLEEREGPTPRLCTNAQPRTPPLPAARALSVASTTSCMPTRCSRAAPMPRLLSTRWLNAACSAAVRCAATSGTASARACACLAVRAIRSSAQLRARLVALPRSRGTSSRSSDFTRAASAAPRTCSAAESAASRCTAGAQAGGSSFASHGKKSPPSVPSSATAEKVHRCAHACCTAGPLGGGSLSSACWRRSRCSCTSRLCQCQPFTMKQRCARGTAPPSPLSCALARRRSNERAAASHGEVRSSARGSTRDAHAPAASRSSAHSALLQGERCSPILDLGPNRAP